MASAHGQNKVKITQLLMNSVAEPGHFGRFESSGSTLDEEKVLNASYSIYSLQQWLNKGKFRNKSLKTN